MAVFDIFKRKKEKKEKPVEKKEAKVKTEKPEKEVLEDRALSKPERAEKREAGQGYRILKSPQITEKATGLAEKNQYTFKIYSEANKVQVKKAVEGLYNVEVKSVRIVKVPSRRRRLGRISGWRQGYKKAIVEIKAGQKIEVLPR